MNTYLSIAIILVNFALASYTTSFILEEYTKIFSRRALALLSIGVVFDFSGTLLMFLGSSHQHLISHGIIGYAALLIMMIDCGLQWRNYAKHGNKAPLQKSLRNFNRFAYIWWLIAYVIGVFIALIR